MKKETLFKKFYKKCSRVLNKKNGFKVSWLRFIPSYFAEKSEMRKYTRAFPSVMNCHTVSIKINGKYTFLPASCTGEIYSETFVRLLKDNGVDIELVK